MLPSPFRPPNSARCCVGSTRAGTRSSTPEVQGGKSSPMAFGPVPQQRSSSARTGSLSHVLGELPLVCFTHTLQRSLLLLASALLLWLESLPRGCRLCFPSSGFSGPAQPQKPSSVTLISLLPSPSWAWLERDPKSPKPRPNLTQLTWAKERVVRL